ncbi:hypothetical protein C4573_01375 [Candidatus Woesearchaeota archaeon]|nr:MAG: hypothetical protein C4573_01375 [Candidatus Woesearchaeota archaeon]
MKAIMKNYWFILFILLIPVASAEVFYAGQNYTLEKDGKEILVQSVAEDKILLKVEKEVLILKMENAKRFNDLRFYVYGIQATQEQDYVVLGICSNEEETCNGIDDDCNGRIDDNLEKSCGIGIGICTRGKETCVNGEWTSCDAPLPQAEICNGIDDDCDNATDEELPERICGLSEGECAGGIQSCTNGSWTVCDDKKPLPEICDSKDNDCDGIKDNHIVCNEVKAEKQDNEEKPDETEGKSTVLSRLWDFIKSIL